MTILNLDHFFEGYDLSSLHIALSLIGMFLAVYAMKLVDYVQEDFDDPWVLRSARRAILMMIALAMLWSLSYSETKGWQPWPPDLVIIALVVAMLVVRITAVHARLLRENDRWPFDRPFAPHHASSDVLNRVRGKQIL